MLPLFPGIKKHPGRNAPKSVCSALQISLQSQFLLVVEVLVWTLRECWGWYSVALNKAGSSSFHCIKAGRNNPAWGFILNSGPQAKPYEKDRKGKCSLTVYTQMRENAFRCDISTKLNFRSVKGIIIYRSWLLNTFLFSSSYSAHMR